MNSVEYQIVEDGVVPGGDVFSDGVVEIESSEHVPAANEGDSTASRDVPQSGGKSEEKRGKSMTYWPNCA